MADVDQRLEAALKQHRGGNLAAAAAGYRAILAEAPAHPEALHLLGVATLQGGDAAGAAQLIERAIVAKGDVARYHVNLGEARRSLDALDAAVAAYRQALVLDPMNAAAHNNLGAVLMRQGEVEPAVEALEAGAAAAPKDAQLLANLGTARLRLGRVVPALDALANAVILEPHQLAYRQLLVKAARRMPSTDLPPIVWRQLLDCFPLGGIDLQPLTRPVLAVAKRTPEFQAIEALAGETPDGAAAALATGAGVDLLASHLFNDLLCQVLVTDARTEAALARIRRHLLQEAADEARRVEGGLLGSQPNFAASLANQVHVGGYLLPTSAEELAMVDHLAGRLAQDVVLGRLTANDPASILRLLAVAGYRPLYGPGAEALGGVAGMVEMAADRLAPRFRLLVRRQIIEPKQEAELARGLETLAPGAAVDETPGVSGPRWQTATRAPPAPLAAVLGALLPTYRLPPGRPEVLIAGAGMGKDAIELAAHLADARVTAIDPRRADLAYAKRAARDQGVAALQFALGRPRDVAPETRYHLIQALGSFRDSDDPAADLAALARALLPGGAIKLVLPTASAQQALIAAQAHVAAAGLAPRQLEAARAMLLALPDDHPARAVADRDGFYARPSAAALLFGRGRPGFSLEQALSLVAGAGLQLLGLQADDALLTDRAQMRETGFALQLWAAKPSG